MTDTAVLTALVPVIALLFLGVATAIGSRAVGLSPIVGYLVLGLGLRASGLGMRFEESTIAVLAQLGVVFLLFEIGLHFSLEHLRKQAADIFAFGPLQVALATLALGGTALLFGLTPMAAFLGGAVLALSSTAVVAQLIAERHQLSCPVGLTATSILIFQDVAAIFLLIIANSLDSGGPLWKVGTLALAKAAIAFAVTVVLARLVVGPFLRLVARTRNEEVFTATALLIALAAGWATGRIGLSLTLGAFLGGLALAETPYRAIVESEIKPFRGLLLGFFFVSIGLSLETSALASSLHIMLGLTVLVMAVKILTNIVASRVFHWSVPGSTQLGFLLAQGSEFAFVLLSLAPVRRVIGEYPASIIIGVVALSIAVTPSLAEAGRRIAGRMRQKSTKAVDPELTMQSVAAPVIIVGMGAVGRTVADALIHLNIGYFAVERDQQRLQRAIADGYIASFGDGFDPRMWGPNDLRRRKLSVLTAPDVEALRQTAHLAKTYFPELKRFVIVADEIAAQEIRNIGLLAIVDASHPRGVDVARVVLSELGVPLPAVEAWVRGHNSPQWSPTALATAAA
jgi:CPA2 family monovalent cation:H+ antiporter-2